MPRTQTIYFSRPLEGRTATQLLAVATGPKTSKRFSLQGRDYYEVYEQAAQWLADETGLPKLNDPAGLATRYGLQLETRNLVVSWSPKDE